MALILRFAFFGLLLLPYPCEAKAEDCSESQCLLVPDGDDLVASKFHFKASQKGVRLVYINLVIGNASYDPLDLPDVFLPHRWVWANTSHEPMLSLPDDYDILSVGLLNYQVRNIDVKLKDHPSGCVAKLDSTCQNLAVGRMLLEKVTSSISGDTLDKKTPLVCIAMINRTVGNVRYHHCCHMDKEATRPATIRCDMTVYSGDSIFHRVLFVLYLLLLFLLTFYIPMFPLILPNVFSLQNEVEKESHLSKETILETTQYGPMAEGEQDNQRGTGADRRNTEDEASLPTTICGTATTAADASSTITTINTDREETDQNTSNCAENSRKRGEEIEFIPVDDSSPINVSTLLRECFQKLPDIPMLFNIKLAVLLLFVFPFVSYFQMVLYPTVKEKYLNECRKKQVSFKEITVFSQFFFFVPIDEGKSRPFLIVVVLTLAFLAFILNPKHFIIPEGIECLRCRNYSQMVNNAFPFSDRRPVRNEIRRHQRIMRHLLGILIRRYGRQLVYCLKSVSHSCCNRTQKSLPCRAICFVFCLILIPFAVILVLVALPVISTVLFLLIFAYYEILYSPFVTMCEFGMKLTCDGELRNICSKIQRVLVICACFFLFFIIFWVSTTSVYFVSDVVEYTVLIGLTLNLDILTPSLAFLLVLTTNLYLCYAKLQSKYKEVKKMISEKMQELQLNSNVPKHTIRAEFFWFVCDKLLPIKSEMCQMLCNMFAVTGFLVLALFYIIAFGNKYDISTLTTTISVFFTGSIPSLFVKVLTSNSNIMGWPKIKMERKIEKAVIKYRDSRNAETVGQQIADTQV